MGMEQIGDSIPWMDDELASPSTSLPEILEETGHVTTVVIFVISAVLTITLLFVIAIFIDCRQQKLIDMKTKKPRRRLIRIKVPGVGKPAVREDEDTIVDKMQEGEPSSSSSTNVIIV